MSAMIDMLEPTLRKLVAAVATELERAGLDFGHGADNAYDEAAWLVLEAVGRSPVEAVPDADAPLAAADVAAVDALARRRIETRRPLAYLTGRAWFAGLEFRVDERSLVPRSPMAELIEQRFAPWLVDRPVERILEIGTGGGCIAIACAYAFPEAQIDATDVDPEALALAGENVAAHGVGERVALHRADVYAGLPAATYDLILSNPPYVDAERMATLPAEFRHEPSGALAGGARGLDVIDRIIGGADRFLAADGLLAVETGGAGEQLERDWPHLAFVWPELVTGDAGIALLDGAALHARA